MQKVDTAYYELEGTHYEIGRQMARLLGKEDLHGIQLEHITDEDIDEALAMYDKYCPGITEELRGYSDETGYPVKENFYTFMSYLVPRCSSVALLSEHTQNGHVIIGRNYEFGLEDEDFHVYRIAPEGKYAHIGGSIIEFGRTEGINECGLAVSMSSCGMPVSNIPQMRSPMIKGLGFFPVIRSLLENCKNVEEALALIQTMPIAYNMNLIMADREHRIALVETMNGEIAVQRGGANEAPTFLCATNHIAIDSFQNREPMGMRNSVVRYNALQNFIQSSEKVSEEQVKQFLLTKYPEGMTAWYYKDWFGTIKSVILDVDDGRYSICWGGRGENGWEDFYVNQKKGNQTKEIQLECEAGNMEFFEFIPLK